MKMASQSRCTHKHCITLASSSLGSSPILISLSPMLVPQKKDRDSGLLKLLVQLYEVADISEIVN